MVDVALQHGDSVEQIKDSLLSANYNKMDIILNLLIMAAIFEFMFMHKTPVKVIISEYLKTSDFFLEGAQKSFLNAILDKISKKSRVKDE